VITDKSSKTVEKAAGGVMLHEFKLNMSENARLPEKTVKKEGNENKTSTVMDVSVLIALMGSASLPASPSLLEGLAACVHVWLCCGAATDQAAGERAFGKLC